MCIRDRLSVIERGHAHADHQRKLGLCDLELGPNSANVGRFEGGDQPGPERAATDLASLLHAGDELLEISRIHRNSSATRRRSTLSCAGVRLSCTFLAYAT